MFKVDDKDVIFTNTFFVRDNELVVFDFECPSASAYFPPTLLTVQLHFEEPTNLNIQSLWTFENNIITFKFTGWAKYGSPPLTYPKPMALGHIYDKPLGFNISSSRLANEIYLVNLQFYLGGTYA